MSGPIRWTRRFLRDVFARPTNTKFNGYQSGNYVVLRWIIEGLTEVPFHEYVKLRILDPAGARNMSPSMLDDPPERRALAYPSMFTKLNPDNVPVLTTTGPMPAHYYFYAGAGGYWGSVADINRWLQQLLDPAATVYTSSARDLLLSQSWFGGGASAMTPWGLAVIKNGGAWAFNSCMALVPAERLSAVLIVNNDGIDAQGALLRALQAPGLEITNTTAEYVRTDTDPQSSRRRAAAIYQR